MTALSEREYLYRTRITIDVTFRATDNRTAQAESVRIANEAAGSRGTTVERLLYAEWER